MDIPVIPDRIKVENGIPIPDRIKVNNGSIMAMAGHLDVLGTKLDELVLMVLDYDIHKILDDGFLISSN